MILQTIPFNHSGTYPNDTRRDEREAFYPHCLSISSPPLLFRAFESIYEPQLVSSLN